MTDFNFSNEENTYGYSNSELVKLHTRLVTALMSLNDKVSEYLESGRCKEEKGDFVFMEHDEIYLLSKGLCTVAQQFGLPVKTVPNTRLKP